MAIRVSLFSLTLLLGLALTALVWSPLGHFLHDTASPPPPAQPEDTRALLLQCIRRTGELTTAIACVQTVVHNRQQAQWAHLTTGSVELLYVATGEVRAGINLRELPLDAITLEHGTVTVALPPCHILSSGLDVNRSYVYDLRRSLLWPPSAAQLQSETERIALARMRETAEENGLLQQAQQQAQQLLRGLLTSAGVKEVRFTNSEESEAEQDAPINTAVPAGG